jgi:hypothetical protein
MKQIFAALALSLCITGTQAQSVDEIVENHLKAMGGKEKMAALQSLVMKGTLNVQGFDVEITQTTVQGVGSRTDINVPTMGEGYLIVTPTKGWNFMPFQGMSEPEEMPEAQLKSRQSQLDLTGSFYNYKEKGNTIELAGKEAVDGKDCFKLKLTNKAGKVTTMFLDASTYYRVKTVSMVETEQGEVESVTTFSNFKPTPEGYVYPMSTTNQQGTTEFSSVEVNKKVDEKIFQIK